MGLFVTMRDVKRAINSFMAEVCRQELKSKGGVLSVDWVDLAGLAAIKALEPSLYKNLYDIYLTVSNISDIERATKELNERWMEDVVLASVNPQRKAAVKLFMKWNMGIELQNVSSGPDRSKNYYVADLSRNDVALANHSLMSIYCIDNYFTGKDCVTCVPNVAQAAFLAQAISDDKKALETAKEIAKEGKLAYLAQILYEFRSPSESKALVTYMASLMRMADENWPESQFYPKVGNGKRPSMDIYGRFVIAIEGKLGDATFFSIDLARALERTGTYYVALMIVSHCWRNGYGYNFIQAGKPQSPNAEKIINLILRNALVATATGKILTHPHKDMISKEICRLISSTSDNKLLEMFRNLYEKLSGLTRVAPLMISESCKEVVGGEAGGEYIYILDYAKFESTLGEKLADVVITQLDALKANKEVGSAVGLALGEIRACREKKMAGQPYDRETLMKEFRDNLAFLQQLKH